jgi:hypothetical protein
MLYVQCQWQKGRKQRQAILDLSTTSTFALSDVDAHRAACDYAAAHLDSLCYTVPMWEKIERHWIAAYELRA